MSLDTMTSKTAEHVCNKSGCPALKAVCVKVFGEDFGFCQHHHNELEPMFKNMLLGQLAHDLATITGR